MGDEKPQKGIPVRIGKPREDLDRDDVADELRDQGMRVAHVESEPVRDEEAEARDAAALFHPHKKKTSQLDPDTKKD